MADADAAPCATVRRESVEEIWRDAGDLGQEVMANYSAGERAVVAEATRGISSESNLDGEWSIVSSGSGEERPVDLEPRVEPDPLAEAGGQAGVQDSLESPSLASSRSWRNLPSVIAWTAGIGPAPGPRATTSTSLVAGEGAPLIGEVKPENLFAAARWPEYAWRLASYPKGNLVRAVILLREKGRLLPVLLVVALAILTLFTIPAKDTTSRTVCVTSNSDGILDWAMNLATSAPTKIRLRRLMAVLDEDIKLDSKDEIALQPKSPTVWWHFSWFQEAPCDKVVIIVRASQLASGRNPLHKYSSKTKTRLLLEHPEATLAVVNATCEGTDDA